MTGQSGPDHDIRFALMAVVPDRRSLILDRLVMLRSNRNIVVAALKELVEHSDVKRPHHHRRMTNGLSYKA